MFILVDTPSPHALTPAFGRVCIPLLWRLLRFLAFFTAFVIKSARRGLGHSVVASLCLLLIAAVEGVLALSGHFMQPAERRTHHTNEGQEDLDLNLNLNQDVDVEERQAIEQKIWQSIWRVRGINFDFGGLAFALLAFFSVSRLGIAACREGNI